MNADQYFIRSEFRPALTPPEMLSLGVFGGYYFGEPIPDEYPQAWRDVAIQADHHSPELNAFKVHSGMSLEVWQKKGWIHEDDPCGWFQWYCRYYMGRRHEDDYRQIKRWIGYKRHRSMLLRNSRGNPAKGIVQRQSLLHWAYDPFPDLRTKIGESVAEKVKRILEQ